MTASSSAGYVAAFLNNLWGWIVLGLDENTNLIVGLVVVFGFIGIIMALVRRRKRISRR